VASRTFTPAADSYVSSAKPRNNYGMATRLKVDESPVLTTYIRFDVTNLTDPVTRATLQVFSRSTSSVGFELHAVADNTWQESAITYANAPGYSAGSSGASGAVRSGAWVMLDVTPLVTGNGPVGFALVTPSTSELANDSRQGPRGPKLIVETASRDVTPPTTPTNLTVTSTTQTSLGLWWSASSDDTGVTGYDVFVNGTRVDSTTSNAYTFGGLACGTAYTLGVEAYDAAGNHSGRATLDASTSACSDTQPPSQPTNLAISAANQTSLGLSWTASTDNVGVAGYDLYLNGTRLGSTTGTSFTFAGLICATSYTLGVEAFDAAGNHSTRASLVGSTTACGAAPTFRFAYFGDSDPAANRTLGATLIDVGSRSAADGLPTGLQGMVWVGDYDNTTCSWSLSDSALTSAVTAARGDPKVFGWFFSDEPNPYRCPSAPAQHRARSDLVHSIDPRTRTVIVLDSNGFAGRATRDALLQLPLWRGAADYVGLDPYPCYQGSACDFSWIDKTIRAANAAGLSYWGVLQAFDDSSWRWPTAAELSHMVNQWARSRESGSMTFAWTWDGHDLSSKPELLNVLRRFNGRPATCVVPNVVGLSLRRARAAVRRAGCALVPVTKRYSSRRSGRVVAEQPRAGTRLRLPGRVRLVVSKGRR
jgi:chitodextrinase